MFVSHQGKVECEGPNTRLYEFSGNITIQNDRWGTCVCGEDGECEGEGGVRWGGESGW